MFDLDLHLRRGDFDLQVRIAGTSPALALFGPSGCGKTSILLALAGLLRPQAGRIVLAGRVLLDAAAGIDIDASRRRLGVVFQDDRLFPHLDVRDNLRYGCPRPVDRAAFDAAVALLELAPLLRRRPGALSGGEARRVAIGRALLAQPAALLLDEPLTGLHREARGQVLAHLRRLRRETRLPMVLVSHYPAEVLALDPEVVLLDDGRVTAREDAAAFARRHGLAVP